MVAIARFCPALLVALIALGADAPANAQIVFTKPYASLFMIPGTEVVRSRSLQDASTVSSVSEEAQSTAPETMIGQAPRGVLPAMYAGLVTLQALDAHSTLRAIDRGHREQNPLMRWATGHPVAFVSMKAVGTAGTVFVAEKIRKKHPKRAIAFIAAVNAAYAVVVLHNYRAGSQRQ